MSDESIVNLSDTTKASMRNYAMVAGLVTIFIFAAIEGSMYYMGKAPSTVIGLANYTFFTILIGTSLMMIGSALAFLHKRDLVAITFLLLAIILMANSLGDFLFEGVHSKVRYPALVIAVILGVAMLFTRNEQKYVCGLILIPYSILVLIYGFNLSGMGAYFAANVVLALVSLYSAICIGLENPKFPGYSLLTADEIDQTNDGSPVHFKVSGSILGYALMMIPAVCVICGYFHILHIYDVNGGYVKACEVSCGLMLTFAGSLMLTAGRMKFTPFMFMMIGVAMMLRPIVDSGWVLFIFLLVIGLMCLLRSEKRILVGISAIMLGLIDLLGPGGICPCVELGVAIAVIMVAILSYVCFALCSDDRLKLI